MLAHAYGPRHFYRLVQLFGWRSSKRLANQAVISDSNRTPSATWSRQLCSASIQMCPICEESIDCKVDLMKYVHQILNNWLS